MIEGYKIYRMINVSWHIYSCCFSLGGSTNVTSALLYEKINNSNSHTIGGRFQLIKWKMACFSFPFHKWVSDLLTYRRLPPLRTFTAGWSFIVEWVFFRAYHDLQGGDSGKFNDHSLCGDGLTVERWILSRHRHWLAIYKLDLSAKGGVHSRPLAILVLYGRRWTFPTYPLQW